MHWLFLTSNGLKLDCVSRISKSISILLSSDFGRSDLGRLISTDSGLEARSLLGDTNESLLRKYVEFA